MAKGDIMRKLLRMKHSPAGKKHLKGQKKRVDAAIEKQRQKKKKDTEPTYFRGKAFERESIESQLRKAGVDPARFKSKKK